MLYNIVLVSAVITLSECLACTCLLSLILINVKLHKNGPPLIHQLGHSVLTEKGGSLFAFSVTDSDPMLCS